MLRRTLSEAMLAGWEERPREVAAIAVSESVVTVTHFTSMALSLYTRIWWWDILVHAAFGLGVAATLYVLNPRLPRSQLVFLIVPPMAVAAIGAWFKVYERFFIGFWVEWPHSVYLEDATADIVAGTTGVVISGVVKPLWNRIRRWRDPNRL